MTNHRVLLVDDEPNILSSLKRNLRQRFEVETANSGEAALTKIKEEGPFAVVVADMNMPIMDGVQLLGHVQKVSPDSVRIMLTGNNDQDTAAKAVNESNIFRFLTKPCYTENIVKAIEDGMRQYQLVTAEKDLLQNTLSGSIKVLTDILSILDPHSFGRAMQLRDPIRKLSKELGVENAWEIELAAMLSNIGWVMLPPSVSAKVREGEQLSPEEEAMVTRIPEVGRQLLSNIPRLEGVAKIVFYQNKSFDGAGYPDDKISGDKIPLGSRILKVVHDFFLNKEEMALKPEAEKAGWYDPKVLEAFVRLFGGPQYDSATSARDIGEITFAELRVGHAIASDIKNSSGLLIIPAGQVMTSAALQLLCNHESLTGIIEPIVVYKD